MYNKNGFAVLSLLLAASCTVGPDYKRPKFYPDASIEQSLQLNPQAASEVSLDWYKQFNDPFLNTLIARGVNYSPTIGAAVEKLRQARQSLRINAVQNFPDFDADGSYHYVKDSVSYGIPLSTDYYQLGIDASWELDIWGGGRRLTESSLALVREAAANLNNVRLSLTAEIAADYVSLRQAQEQLRISQKNLVLQKSIYDLVKQKSQAGLADDIALNQASYAVKTTSMLIPQLEQQVEAYENALAILTGRLPGELKDMLDNPEHNLVAAPFAYDLQRLYALPVDVIRNRPDVQVSEQQLVAQNAKIGQAIAELFPSVSLSGFIGYQGPNIHRLVSPDHDMYSYSPSITLPLFHWGALMNNVELQKSIAKEDLYLYKASILNAAAEIRNAMVNVEKEYNRNASARQAVSAQRKVSSLTLGKYKQGLISFSDVLTAQQDLLSSENEMAASNAAIYQNIISFYKAVGGGYKPVATPAAKKANALCKG